jgi:hypothetical protein
MEINPALQTTINQQTNKLTAMQLITTNQTQDLLINECEEIVFLPEAINIPEENKLEVYRFNIGDKSPFFQGAWTKWDYNMKAFKIKKSTGPLMYALANSENSVR